MNMKFGQVVVKVVMLNMKDWKFVAQRLDGWSVEKVTVRSQTWRTKLSGQLGRFGVQNWIERRNDWAGRARLPHLTD